MKTELAPWRIMGGDCRDRLRELDAGSAQTCVTSPPYFGLRDYGNDGQIGLEPTPDEYVQALVGVFREVRRVLREDGTLWLNLGDSYASSPPGNSDTNSSGLNGAQSSKRYAERLLSKDNRGPRTYGAGIKQKDLVGIPWMVAFALRADGWYLRSDIIWAKPNPMPESVTDRPTKAHEYLFLLSKGPTYFYDADAVREQDSGKPSGNGFVRDHRLTYQNADGSGRGNEDEWEPGGGRNKRSVWTVATQPFPGAHFAVFPPKLIEPCVLAGSAERACGVCGAPWRRVTKPTLAAMLRSDRPQRRRAAELAGEAGLTDEHLAAVRATGPADVGQAKATQNGVNAAETARLAAEAKQALGGYFREFSGPVLETVGWDPGCPCDTQAPLQPDRQGTVQGRAGRSASDGIRAGAGSDATLAPGAHPQPTASVVLDPFAGAGTTGLVATRHGRGFIGIELNGEYAEMARNRIRDDQPLFNYLTEQDLEGR